MQLLKHTYKNRPTRYYINNIRVTEEYFNRAIDRLQVAGMKMNSFVTEQVNNEHFKHYSSI